MKLSEYYGKQIFSEKGGAAYIIKIFTDGEKIAGFACADEGEREFYIPFKNVHTNGGALTYASGAKQKPEHAELKLGIRCYDARGGYIGTLRDFICKNGKLITAKIGAKSFLTENLVLGDIVLIKPHAAALKFDVKKNGKVLFKSGEKPDKKMLSRAISLGEYVQTNLKTI